MLRQAGRRKGREGPVLRGAKAEAGMARMTGLEPATSGVTGRRSNQLSYIRVRTSEPVQRGA
jgi:hypothetical protein